MSTEVNETTPSSKELEPVLQFKELDVSFRTEFGRVQAVKGVSLAVKPGEVVALVGHHGPRSAAQDRAHHRRHDGCGQDSGEPQPA